MTDRVPVTRALISLSDKSGLDRLAAGLAELGVEIVSTGGTAARLRDNGAQVRDVSELTGFPEMMDGRVKTLHPKVHGALLGVRDNDEHMAAMAEHGIAAIDLVVVNLYPFEATLARGAGRDEIIENIDIGGPSMVRSAAKNHAHVAIITDPADYDELLAELRQNGGATSLDFRKRLAAKAFALTAAYDSMISQWFAFGDQQQRWPESWTFSSKLKMPLRYGENPHQQAAYYRETTHRGGSLSDATLLQGRLPTFNDLLDLDTAYRIATDFTGPTCCIAKQRNPTGLASNDRLSEAYVKALEGDPVSALT